MSLDRLDPLNDTFVISTGSRQKGKKNFAEGDLLTVKNLLTNMGLNVINDRRTAKYVVIPDGALPGRIDATPVHYSKIVYILQNSKSVKKERVKKKVEDKKVEIVGGDNFPQIDVSRLEAELAKLEESDD